MRADAADALYMQLLAMDDAELPGAELAAAQDLLASTAWDGPAAAAVAARDALYAPLGLPCPVQTPSPETLGPAKQAGASSGGKTGGAAGVLVTCVADEHATYAALLVDAGRGI